MWTHPALQLSYTHHSPSPPPPLPLLFLLPAAQRRCDTSLTLGLVAALCPCGSQWDPSCPPAVPHHLHYHFTTTTTSVLACFYFQRTQRRCDTSLTLSTGCRFVLCSWQRGTHPTLVRSECPVELLQLVVRRLRFCQTSAEVLSVSLLFDT
jgi:hypothetical protein